MKQVRVREYFETEDNNYCSSVFSSEVLVNASLNKTRQKNVNQKIFLLKCGQSTLLIRRILLIKTFKSKMLYKQYLFIIKHNIILLFVKVFLFN